MTSKRFLGRIQDINTERSQLQRGFHNYTLASAFHQSHRPFGICETVVDFVYFYAFLWALEDPGCHYRITPVWRQEFLSNGAGPVPSRH